MKKRPIIIILVFFIIAAAALFFTMRGGSPAPQKNPPNGPAVSPAPPAPKTPIVTLVIKKSKKGNSFIIQWENLPEGTTGLNIYRGKTGTDQSTWSLWKTVSIASGQLGGGSITIDLGSATLAGYSFYTQAVTGGGRSGSGGDGGVLWTSSSTVPSSATSTPQTPGGSSPPSPPPSSPPSSTATTTTTSTPQTPPPSGGQTGTSTTGTPSGGQAPSSTGTPTGTPYYTPQIQISGYGQGPSGNFWVQHIDQKIQIGWQNLPPQTTNLAIYRSSNQSGPWTTVLTQTNPRVSGAYSIQIVDDTLGNPYYYKMDALAGSSTVATYGPIYLPPLGQ